MNQQIILSLVNLANLILIELRPFFFKKSNLLESLDFVDLVTFGVVSVGQGLHIV